MEREQQRASNEPTPWRVEGEREAKAGQSRPPWRARGFWIFLIFLLVVNYVVLRARCVMMVERVDLTSSSANRDTCPTEQRNFSPQEARDIGERIGIDWKSARFDVEHLRMGLDVELEHGRHGPVTNVSDDDRLTTGKIAWPHLNEFPDYYTRLAKV